MLVVWSVLVSQPRPVRTPSLIYIQVILHPHVFLYVVKTVISGLKTKYAIHLLPTAKGFLSGHSAALIEN